MYKAMFWKPMNGNVQCRLCHRHCVIAEGSAGMCRVRKNVGGTLQSLVFGRPCSIAADPIEKKPFFHFAPGTKALSVATVGCNFFCKYCQNIEISHPDSIFGNNTPPKELAKLAKNYPGFAWTYTEPTVFFEYFYETAKLSKDKYHVWVTNGYTAAEALKKAAKFLSAANVDYKGDEKFYREVCNTELGPVRKTLKLYKKLGIWIEITNLLVPGYNNDDNVVLEMARWIAENLGRQTPLHISRYHPYHEMKAPPTTLEQLECAAKIAEEYLDFVYIGNMPNNRENTLCPNCRYIVIERSGFSVRKIDVTKKGKGYACPECSARIPLAGMEYTKSGKQ